MILAIYKKNKPKDKWLLSSLAPDALTAKKYSRMIKKHAKQLGYEEAQSTIQSFDTVHDVPKILENPKSEKLIYN
jgi:hypothetical protein